MALSPTANAVNVARNESSNRTVWRLAWPTVVAMLAQSLVNEVDIVFLGWLPGAEASNAQAALFPSLILLWLLGGSLSAISVGTQALTARRFAENKPVDAGSVLVNSFVTALISGVVVTALGYACLPFILDAVVTVPAVRADAESYLGWRLLGITSMVTTFSF